MGSVQKTGRRRPGTPRTAIQQGHPRLGLQLADHPAGIRLIHTELPGARAEPALVDDRDEERESLEDSEADRAYQKDMPYSTIAVYQ